MKCKVCGEKLRLDKERRYEVVKIPTGLGIFSGERTTVFEAFDCPKCGCQNIVNVKEVSTNVANEKSEDEE